MGNKICFHPRVILTEDIALHFKSSNLVRDVIPILEKWRADGAELCFSIKEFQSTFDVVTLVEEQFKTFDTDDNGRVDAHEVLMVYTLLSSGDVLRKIHTVFSTFDYSGRKGHLGTINFDEAMIMIEACVKGLQKVCSLDFKIGDDEILFYCKSLFDMHHVPHSERIALRQFQNWCTSDPAPKAFLALFHESQGLPDIYAAVQRVCLEQSQVFQMLAQNQLHVQPEVLIGSESFRRLLKDPRDHEVQALVALMLDDGGRVTLDGYHSVLRPWNIFNECDLDCSGELDDKEMEILLWIQLRRKPDREFVGEFIRMIDDDSNGVISRTEWVKAIIESHNGAKLASRPGSRAASRASRRTSVALAQAAETQSATPDQARKQALRASMQMVAGH